MVGPGAVMVSEREGESRGEGPSNGHPVTARVTVMRRPSGPSRFSVPRFFPRNPGIFRRHHQGYAQRRESRPVVTRVCVPVLYLLSPLLSFFPPYDVARKFRQNTHRFGSSISHLSTFINFSQATVIRSSPLQWPSGKMPVLPARLEQSTDCDFHPP